MKIMIGKNRCPHAEQVFESITQQRVVLRTGSLVPANQIGEDQSSLLIDEMLALYLIRIKDLCFDKPNFDQDHFCELMSTVVIFAKIVKQDPTLLEKIEERLVQLCENEDIQLRVESMVGHGKLSEATRALFPASDEHFMRHKTPALFVFTLFTLLKIEEYVACKGEIKQVLDALASIVCAYDALKKTVMDLIQYYEGQCDFKLAFFVNHLCTGQENAHHEFPVSMAYLRFINKVYKCELPQMLLEREN